MTEVQSWEVGGGPVGTTTFAFAEVIDGVVKRQWFEVVDDSSNEVVEVIED